MCNDYLMRVCLRESTICYIAGIPHETIIQLNATCKSHTDCSNAIMITQKILQASYIVCCTFPGCPHCLLAFLLFVCSVC